MEVVLGFLALTLVRTSEKTRNREPYTNKVEITLYWVVRKNLKDQRMRTHLFWGFPGR